MLFDFAAPDASVDDWVEVSDTARSAGLSKGSIDIIHSTADPRAVFFSLLVPQPDSACFAGNNVACGACYDHMTLIYDPHSMRSLLLHRRRAPGRSNTQSCTHSAPPFFPHSSLSPP